MTETFVLFRDFLISIAISLLGGAYEPDRKQPRDPAPQERSQPKEECESDCAPAKSFLRVFG